MIFLYHTPVEAISSFVRFCGVIRRLGISETTMIRQAKMKTTV